LEIVSPTDGSIVDGLVTISVMYSTPNVGMPVIEVFVDGVFLDSQTAPWFSSAVDFVWDTTGLTVGSTHVISVRGTLWNGELREDSVTVTVTDQSVEAALAALQLQLVDVQMGLYAMMVAMAEANASTMAYLQTQLAILQGALTQIGAGLTQLAAGSVELNATLTATLVNLQGQLGDFQTQLDDFQVQIDRIENKADTAGTFGIVTMVLVLIIVALLALNMLMARKKQ
jgi:hypothetical protein